MPRSSRDATGGRRCRAWAVGLPVRHAPHQRKISAARRAGIIRLSRDGRCRAIGDDIVLSIGLMISAAFQCARLIISVFHALRDGRGVTLSLGALVLPSRRSSYSYAHHSHACVA